MALAGTFERLKPDFAGVGQVPAGDQKVVPGRLLVAFEAKRGIGDDDAVENFAQRHDGRHVGGDRLRSGRSTSVTSSWRGYSRPAS